ncbi:hypothetical protein SAMN04488059_101113 [Devosia psychrophila]|uniref:UPF0235 protein SAMN04488059_101113 n=1 Tax=Devosia psychrophila TaxID=728005 RepID=A0A1I1F908_9HYPH|nr:DUF167 family protein [Devosia psychrophila]SFB93633.1 hypothetical protein SAMN04488059_101113 [Devosia psychrophila]
MSDIQCYRLSPSGLSLFVRVTPNAGRDAIEGVALRDDGTAMLRVRVSAVPDKGKANAAVIALLAKALGVPKSSITVTSGETSRMKTLAVVGDGPTLIAALSKNTPT